MIDFASLVPILVPKSMWNSIVIGWVASGEKFQEFQSYVNGQRPFLGNQQHPNLSSFNSTPNELGHTPLLKPFTLKCGMFKIYSVIPYM
jgi:hypothetical protein